MSFKMVKLSRHSFWVVQFSYCVVPRFAGHFTHWVDWVNSVITSISMHVHPINAVWIAVLGVFRKKKKVSNLKRDLDAKSRSERFRYYFDSESLWTSYKLLKRGGSSHVGGVSRSSLRTSMGACSIIIFLSFLVVGVQIYVKLNNRQPSQVLHLTNWLKFRSLELMSCLENTLI